MQMFSNKTHFTSKWHCFCDLKEDDRGRKTIKREKMDNIWVEDLPVISTKEHELLGNSELENGN